MKRLIMARYGEIILKGLNRPVFEDALVKNIKGALRHCGEINIHKAQANIYIEPKDDDKTDEIVEILKHVFGVVTIIVAYEVEKDIDAIRKACKKLKTFDLSGCEIYTTGYPCPMCFCAILWANINKVYYGCNTTDTEIIGFRDKEFEQKIPQKKIDICEEIDRKDCLTLYEDYKKIQNKTMY